MTRLLRSAWVIARRDYVATVWSRTFLLFLLGPLLPLLFGGGYGAIMASQSKPEHGPLVRLDMPRADADALIAARVVLARRLGDHALPSLALDVRHEADATLSGALDAPLLTGPSQALRRLSGQIGLIVDQVRMERALGRASPPPVRMSLRPADREERRDESRIDLARGAQFVLFFLTVLLAGMTISNLVEEKSSKVIELLAAAVPVDAIFLGKLVGMLGVSLTGVAVWTSAGVAVVGFLPPQLALPAPAMGWPFFLTLGILYFASVYLLIGALYLGIGAQAGSVREVQTLSMPLTMGQLLIFGLASASVTNPDGAVALIASVVPWTSPFTMLGRAAQRPELWPHVAALVWQLAALALTIRVAARLFRRNVLKSGRGAVSQP
jgi:ABC-2 type transport system permease protein